MDVNGVRWAIVEYEPAVLREEWCEEGHSGYVLEGEIEYEFQRTELPALRVQAGVGFTLPAGSGHRGRAGETGASASRALRVAPRDAAMASMLI